jgi:hypothetical protein
MKNLTKAILGVLLGTVFACGGALPAAGDLTVDTVLDHDSVEAGGQTTVKCVVKDPYGNEVTSGTDVLFQTPGDAEAPVVDKGVFVLTKAGQYRVACQIQDSGVKDSSPAVLTVLPGPPVKTLTTVAPDTVGAGEAARAKCTAMDKYDNPIPDAKTVLDQVKGLDIQGMQVSSKKPGK